MSLECSGGCSAARSFITAAYTCFVKFPVFRSHKECPMLSFLRLCHSPQAKVILLPLKVVTF